MPHTNKPLRLGMITVEPHGKPWAEVMSRNPAAKMVCAWDYDYERAQAYAEKYNIPYIARDVEELLGKVDAVLIGGGRRMPQPGERWGDIKDDHLMLSRPFLVNGLPVLIDKPFSDTLEDAVEMVRLARKHGAPLMSCSAMRYDTAVKAVKEQIDTGGVGKVLTATAFIGTGLCRPLWYLIHMLEAIYVPFGPGIESVSARSSEDKMTTEVGGFPALYNYLFRWNDGRLVSISMAQDDADAASSAGLDNRRQRILWPTDYVIPPYLPLHYVYHIYGDANWTEMRSVGKGCYSFKMEAFLEMVRTGKAAIPLEEMLELAQANILAEKALSSGKVEYMLPIHELLSTT
jgi:predicted dehydrogenase